MARTTKTKVPKEGPFVQTARAKKTPGRTVRVGGTKVLRKAGKPPIPFKVGGLHESLGVPQDKPIPKAEFQAALAGRRGEKAEEQARFKKNVLTGKKGSSKKGMNAAEQARQRRNK